MASVSAISTTIMRRDIYRTPLSSMCRRGQVDSACARSMASSFAPPLALVAVRLSCVRPAATKLIDVHGEDDRRADDDLLPEGLDGLDHEAVLENGGDERADGAAEHRADAAEQARPADHDRPDRAEVVRLVRDRRR